MNPPRRDRYPVYLSWPDGERAAAYAKRAGAQVGRVIARALAEMFARRAARHWLSGHSYTVTRYYITHLVVRGETRMQRLRREAAMAVRKRYPSDAGHCRDDDASRARLDRKTSDEYVRRLRAAGIPVEERAS